MYQSHADVRRELADLKEQAKINERIWGGFRRIEINAIGAETFRQLVHEVVRGIRETFPKVSQVTLACLNIDYEIMRILEQCSHSRESVANFVMLNDDELYRWFPHTPRPLLGSCSPNLRKRLFPHAGRSIRSAAVSPLIASGKLLGCLAQGSEDPRHFSEDTGTELLEHLSATIALCIRNTVNVARLERHGLTDPLTDIPNRRFLERRLGEEIERCLRYGRPLSCVMMDIDFFKKINDRFGHSVGDRVLKGVANALYGGLRASDILSRYGGEEFVLLLPETNLRHGVKIAQRHHRKLGSLAFDIEQAERLKITVSAGVAVLEHADAKSGVDLGRWLLRQSDEALYQAKREGRNRVVAAV